jgi:hypothetical protein
MMEYNFESTVLNLVEPHRTNGSKVYFENGSLFLENIPDDSADNIMKALNGRFDIIVTEYEAINGFVVDFG